MIGVIKSRLSLTKVGFARNTPGLPYFCVSCTGIQPDLCWVDCRDLRMLRAEPNPFVSYVPPHDPYSLSCRRPPRICSY